MKYEEKVREILKLARDAESQGNIDELLDLEHSLIVAQSCKFVAPRTAHRILDEARRTD